ncbi:hypothetical protein [Clostridium mediterraneense]|uniref:hypothetical protein n=1 Tax=Clostridium mediterraneense TaxID=1805472 RepID=UPI00082B38D2|nr:hypothetical protein [Clostridium mediterraneense]
MSKKKIIILIFPLILMFIINGFSFLDIDGIALKGIILFSLIVIYPLSFFIQGILCELNNIEVLSALVISSLGFLGVTFIFLNSSALGYLIFYLIIELIGYFIVKGYRKLITKREI